MTPHKSEVAQFRERQALEEQSSLLGLSGLAIVANHNSVTARLQRGASRILDLMQQGKEQEAVAMMAQPDWGADMQETISLSVHKTLH